MEIPDKLYFRIGEVSRITGVKPYVIRFWESEFGIRPRRKGSNQRLYTKREVELLKEIKRLLHEERYTIEGAKRRLREFQKERQKQLELSLSEDRLRRLLLSLKKDLKELRDMLE